LDSLSSELRLSVLDRTTLAGEDRGIEYVSSDGGTQSGTLCTACVFGSAAADQGEGLIGWAIVVVNELGNGEGRGVSSISRSIIPGVCGASESVVGDGVDRWEARFDGGSEAEMFRGTGCFWKAVKLDGAVCESRTCDFS
jgi:hypothetical protein